MARGLVGMSLALGYDMEAVSDFELSLSWDAKCGTESLSNCIACGLKRADRRRTPCTRKIGQLRILQTACNPYSKVP